MILRAIRIHPIALSIYQETYYLENFVQVMHNESESVFFSGILLVRKLAQFYVHKKCPTKHLVFEDVEYVPRVRYLNSYQIRIDSNVDRQCHWGKINIWKVNIKKMVNFSKQEFFQRKTPFWTEKLWSDTLPQKNYC